MEVAPELTFIKGKLKVQLYVCVQAKQPIRPVLILVSLA